MGKKIVVAVDSSTHAANAVKYAVDLASRVDDLHIKLLHIEPTVSQYILEEARKSAAGRKQLEALHRKNEEVARQLLEDSHRIMRDGDMEERRIEMASLPKKKDVAGDILQAVEEGRYDALVVGRRGQSYLQKWLTGSVTSNLLAHSKVVPVWVVDGKVKADAILVAVDGSAHTLRAIDHLAFMLSGARNLRIELLHVQPRLKDFCEIDFNEQLPESEADIIAESDSRCIDDFYARALAIFQESGIDKQQVKMTTVANLFAVGKTIVEQATSGAYQTMVVGKNATPGSLFTGSVSRYLINNVSDSALWVVP